MDLRDTVLKIDLKALAYNMDQISSMVGPDVAIMPVIKANGYGHGAVGIAKTLIDHNATYLAVATLVEALELREHFPDYPLFILGHTPDRMLNNIVSNNITQTIFSLKQGKILDELSKEAGKKAKVHLKIDTGFHRLGIDNIQELYEICQLSNIEVEGIFTHLALVNDNENKQQFDLFCKIIKELGEKGVSFKYKHLADSIACVDYPQYRMNMIRPGALVFGLKGFHKGFLDVKQVITFETRISQIHYIKTGEGVGYDYLWKAKRDSIIATLPFGYADGYPRNMRDKGYVTIKGVKCPILGVICMDQCMADVTEIKNPQEGDLAIIYGDGSNNTMSIAEAASLSNTNKNEIVSRLTHRPVKIYL